MAESQKGVFIFGDTSSDAQVLLLILLCRITSGGTQGTLWGAED